MRSTPSTKNYNVAREFPSSLPVPFLHRTSSFPLHPSSRAFPLLVPYIVCPVVAEVLVLAAMGCAVFWATARSTSR
jgi:hypothetical protein